MKNPKMHLLQLLELLKTVEAQRADLNNQLAETQIVIMEIILELCELEDSPTAREVLSNFNLTAEQQARRLTGEAMGQDPDD